MRRSWRDVGHVSLQNMFATTTKDIWRISSQNMSAMTTNGVRTYKFTKHVRDSHEGMRDMFLQKTCTRRPRRDVGHNSSQNMFVTTTKGHETCFFKKHVCGDYWCWTSSSINTNLFGPKLISLVQAHRLILSTSPRHIMGYVIFDLVLWLSLSA